MASSRPEIGLHARELGFTHERTTTFVNISQALCFRCSQRGRRGYEAHHGAEVVDVNDLARVLGMHEKRRLLHSLDAHITVTLQRKRDTDMQTQVRLRCEEGMHRKRKSRENQHSVLQVDCNFQKMTTHETRMG